MKADTQRPSRASEPGATVVRLMTALCRHAEADLRRMPRAPAEAVHALRLRMKKLRSLLCLIRGRISQARMNRLRGLIRQIKHAFASRRDFEVMQKLAATMSRRRSLPALKLRRPAEKDEDAASAKSLVSARRKIMLLRREVAALRLKKLTREDVVAGYVRCQHDCRRRWRKCAAGDDAQQMHRWRRHVKHWYYLSLALVRLPHARKSVRQARELGHLLGQVNDLRMLDTHVSGPASARWREVIAGKVRRKKSRLFAVAAKSLHLPGRKLRKVLAQELRGLAAA